MVKKYVLTFDKREFHDLKTAVLLLSISASKQSKMTSEQKKMFKSAKSIAEKLSELDPNNEI